MDGSLQVTTLVQICMLACMHDDEIRQHRPAVMRTIASSDQAQTQEPRSTPPSEREGPSVCLREKVACSANRVVVRIL